LICPSSRLSDGSRADGAGATIPIRAIRANRNGAKQRSVARRSRRVMDASRVLGKLRPDRLCAKPLVLRR
jgi:hypothetical protein